MDDSKVGGSYKLLGRRLKALRVGLNESLAEASGAVEIDARVLASYEVGQARPSEDVLLLLLNHFGVKDDEAVRLWELAGYNMAKVSSAHMINDMHQSQFNTASKATSPILFTDVVDVIVNNYGVVMNFMQNNGPRSVSTPIARVGMSREHAKSVLQILQITLSQTEKGMPKLPRQIISPDSLNSDVKTD